MKPVTYRHQNDITARDVIKIVNAAGYPGYGRPIHSMVENGDNTGICLMPDAMEAVRERYPEYAKILQVSVGTQKAAKARKADNRKLGCRFCFRASEAFKTRLEAAKDALSYSTMQDFLIFALDNFMRDIEKAAPGAATPNTADNRAVSEKHNMDKGECQ